MERRTVKKVFCPGSWNQALVPPQMTAARVRKGKSDLKRVHILHYVVFMIATQGPLQRAQFNFMDDDPGKLKVFPNYFEVSPEPILAENGVHEESSIVLHQRSGSSSRSCGRLSGRRLRKAASMLFNVPGLPWGSGTTCEDKVQLTSAELESLRSEIIDLEEREALLKAQLEHLDELLRSARLAGYLYIRSRWTALPGELPIEETDVDDWLSRFVVLHGSCIFFYLQSTDLSPQDSTLLCDVIEVGQLPSFLQEDEQTRYSFYILTCHGLRLECSTLSEIQVNAWLTALRADCSLGSDAVSKT